MNRKIIFRGKSIEPETNGEWIYGDLIHCISEHYGEQFFILPFKSDKVYKDVLVDSETIGQFVGIYDSYGEKLFEGDIVQGTSSIRYGEVFEYLGYIEWCNQSELIGYHVYDKDGCGWELNRISARISCDNITGKKIGNIWDNKELLEK